MLASKSPFPAPLATSGSGMMAGTAQASYPPSRRAPAVPPASQSFSPTESEFSDSDDHDSPKHWDEDKVCEYLRSVRCGEYEKLFRKNHINGENLLEMDKDVLKEMGIEKVGDRVRLFLSIKKLRTKAIAGQKKRNRVSRGNASFAARNAMADFSYRFTRIPLPDTRACTLQYLNLPASPFTLAAVSCPILQ